MKKKLILSTIFIVFISVLAISCRKDIDNYFNGNSPESVSLEDAKIFFATHATMTSYPKESVGKLMSKSLGSKKVFIKLNPLWKKSKILKGKSSDIIVVPTIDIKFENKKYKVTRVFVFKSQNHQTNSGEIIEILSESGNVDFDEVIKNYDQRSIANFSGIILRYDINYFLLESKYFQNGVKQHKLGKIQSFDSSKTGSEIKSHGTESNDQQCTAFYLITDIYYSDGSYEQTREYLSTVCYDIPGGCTADCSVYDGGGGSAGGNSTNVVNSITEPCIKGAVDLALMSNVSHAIANYMNTAFGQYSVKNLEFKNASIGGDTVATTTGTNNIVITMNSDKLPNYSKEFIVAMAFHEVLHAYLKTLYPANPSTGILSIPSQHEVMITNYVSTITSSLQSVFPNLSNADASGLALIGLEGTTLYQLYTTQQDANRSQASRSYRGVGDNVKGTYCN